MIKQKHEANILQGKQRSFSVILGFVKPLLRIETFS